MKKFLLAAMLLIWMGCKDQDRWAPVGTADSVPPPVTDVQVKNIAGGATIAYTLPEDQDVLYVLATYSIHDSSNLEKKSSFYNNSVTITGFPDTKTYQVKLYTVTRGEKRSGPLTVDVKPLTPPVTSVFNSIKVDPTFGGIRVSFQNENEANVKINVLTTDSLGDLTTADVYYTKRKNGDFSVRGFDSVKRKFGIFVRDRWNNYSDTLFTEQTPWYEEQLDKSKFKEIDLPGDTYKPHVGTGMGMLWDDIWNTGNNVFHTDVGTGIPQWFTFDLGTTVRLSRFKFYHRNAGVPTGAYYAGDPEVFEVYGSNNPNPQGDWDSTWTLLGHFISIEPSGQPTPTTEDIQFACVDGEDFEFSLDDPPIRYLRFKILKTWGGVSYMYISELTFWGSKL
jgi:hypothetical protein